MFLKWMWDKARNKTVRKLTSALYLSGDANAETTADWRGKVKSEYFPVKLNSVATYFNAETSYC